MIIQRNPFSDFRKKNYWHFFKEFLEQSVKYSEELLRDFLDEFVKEFLKKIAENLLKQSMYVQCSKKKSLQSSAIYQESLEK